MVRLAEEEKAAAKAKADKKSAAKAAKNVENTDSGTEE